jgi:protein-tyrosine-phosphatase
MLFNRRYATLLFMAVPFQAQARPCAAPHVLFVCPAGSVKSAIAREELKRLAAAKGVAVIATSRGIHPENHISPQLAERLKAEGIDPLAEPLRSFSPADTKGADILVAFDEAAEAPGLEKARQWEVAAWNGEYETAKTDTLKYIESLLVEIQQHCQSS